MTHTLNNLCNSSYIHICLKENVVLNLILAGVRFRDKLVGARKKYKTKVTLIVVFVSRDGIPGSGYFS